MILREGSYLQERYEILNLIGSGGMSEVYRAVDHRLNRSVAIKVLKKEFSSDAEFVRKFNMEAQAAASLNHPNIVNIYDVIDEEDLHCIVMELIDGATLKEYIRQKGKLDVREAIGMTIQIAQGIGAAHSRRIIHRDVKPQNMILSRDGKVKVADFGIARAVTSQTMSAQAIGSVHYISPEQAKGEYTDERSDIYSLGITLFEMLTGKLPFTGDNAVAVALAHVEQPMTPPSTYNPDVPAALDQIVLKCTEKMPEDRYQNVDDLIRDLKLVLDAPEGENVVLPGSEKAMSSTRVIRHSELARIRRGAERHREALEKRKAAVEKRREENKEKKKDGADGVDSRLNSMIKVVAVIMAIAVAGAILYFLLMFSGMLGGNTAGSGSSEESGESSSALSDKEAYMPYVIGLSEAEAEKKLKEGNLTMTISDRDYSDQFAEGLVMSQSPDPGEVVEKYSKVSVVLSLGPEQTDISQLDLVGMSYEDAADTLSDYGISAARAEDYSDTYGTGMVMSFAPARAKKGDTVTLTVSLGPKPAAVTVPDLRGKTQADADALLASAGLKTGKVSTEPSDTVAAGTVTAQGTDPGASVDSGSAVDYTVSSGIAETEAASTDYQVEPIGGDPNARYVASINNTYELSNMIGPGSGNTSVTVMIRLRQDVSGQAVYTTLMEPRTVTGDTIIPVRFKAIEGAYGVDTGYVEIVDCSTNQVLQSYEVQFFKVQ